MIVKKKLLYLYVSFNIICIKIFNIKYELSGRYNMY